MKPMIQLGAALSLAAATLLSNAVIAEEAKPDTATEAKTDAAPATGQAANAKTDTFDVEGMTCGHCSKTITKAVNKLKGVSNVAVNVEKKQAQVTYDPAQVKADAIATAITASGYKAKLAAPAAAPAEGEKADPKVEEKKEAAPEPKS